MSPVKLLIVAVMDNIYKFVSDHPYSTAFAVIHPIVIPSEYHAVFAQLLLGLGTQIIIYLIEWLKKKSGIRSRKKDYDQSFDDYLDGKNPIEKR